MRSLAETRARALRNMRTLKILKSTAPDFTDAVKEILPTW
jgi:hypothetical protein